MVVTLKFISTALDVSDGAAPSAVALSAHQLASRLRARPSLLAFASYALYPGTVLAGPWHTFAEYALFIERAGVRVPRPVHKQNCCG